jgi:aryl-alcohol dehydrogenase-like predicted oxidoreductase
MSLDFFKNVAANMDATTAKALKLEAVAAKIGCTLPQLAIAWCLSNPNVSTVLLGASRLSQLEENVKAMAFADKITPEIRAEIDEIVDFKPKLPETAPAVFTMREKYL